MKRYLIDFTILVEDQVEIAANSEKEAIKILHKMFTSGEEISDIHIEEINDED